ncbi:MAG: tRNA (N6-isopentenyl adenosine(37)-C2)-methylthiotransferase MiaB [Oscillospiraceae bacterium]|jgi:tRNA-2-methylthio-N6-dimethylallyladenosine synthase|nr:tRNA (N6-isopentenyl adenosine(37)-C2)-methylthiotransferase MiaB [Oscillospiraceae bacterium]
MTDTFAARVREMNADAPASAFVEVFGCQQNEHDGELIRGMLADMGFGFTQDAALAKVVVLNTCAVREHAEQRVLGHLGAIGRAGGSPGRIVAVCGCMAQLENSQNTLKRSYGHVNLVFGPGDLARFPELLYTALTKGGRHFNQSDPTAPPEEGLPVLRAAPPRALVTVMKGCDNFCSYCVVPHTRGRERSRAPEAVLGEVRGLIRQGYCEIMLLGQNVNSYRPNPDSAGIRDFPELLAALASLPGDFSLRFMTSHPKDASDKLFSVMGAYGKIAPFLHLPAQSGSSRVLAAMNRGYTREHYIALTERARAAVPGLNLTSDIMVGFPGETEDDFGETLGLLEKVRFNSLFTFIYSPRPETPAANLDGVPPPEVVKKRFARLLETQKRIEATL